MLGRAIASYLRVPFGAEPVPAGSSRTRPFLVPCTRCRQRDKCVRRSTNEKPFVNEPTQHRLTRFHVQLPEPTGLRQRQLKSGISRYSPPNAFKQRVRHPHARLRCSERDQ